VVDFLATRTLESNLLNNRRILVLNLQGVYAGLSPGNTLR
jgi:hypothetical protein